MPPTTISKEFFTSLDERIKTLHTNLFMVKKEIELKSFVIENQDILDEIFEVEDQNDGYCLLKKNVRKDGLLRLEMFEKQLILLKLEKQMYNAYNKKNNTEIFSKLQTKYTANISTTLELMEKMVENGDIPEGDYLDYAKDSVPQHNFIKKMCEIGENLTKKALKKKM